MARGRKTDKKLTTDSDNDAKNMDTEMVDANSGDLIGGYSFQTPTHTCETVPQSAAQALGEMGISETSTMGGITFLPDRQAIQLYDARKRCCNRYAWVAPIDEKGIHAWPCCLFVLSVSDAT